MGSVSAAPGDIGFWGRESLLKDDTQTIVTNIQRGLERVMQCSSNPKNTAMNKVSMVYWEFV